MRFILIIFLAYIVYKMLKPALRKPKPNPYVRGKEADTTRTEKPPKNIEDAEFEEID